MATPIAKTFRYSDLDMDFVAHPITRDVTRKYDVNAVLRSCRNLVLLAQFEKPFHPEIGAGIRRFLFEPMSMVTAVGLRDEIKRVIDQYEPRAKILRLTVKENETQNLYEISMNIEVLDIQVPVTLNVTLKRLR